MVDDSLMVDAIDDGRIVRVSEAYAIREGLPILRRKEISFTGEKNPEKKATKEEMKKEMRVASGIELFRRPLKGKNDIASTLVDNFHWVLSEQRKNRNLTRHQVSQQINIKEIDLKMLENGVLPSEDYILISKLEQFYGITLRKDGVGPVSLASLKPSSAKPLENKATYKMKDFRQVLREKEAEKYNKSYKDKSGSDEGIAGNDIELELE